MHGEGSNCSGREGADVIVRVRSARRFLMRRRVCCFMTLSSTGRVGWSRVVVEAALVTRILRLLLTARRVITRKDQRERNSSCSSN